MRLADLNGDGKLDIVTANASAASNNISVLQNQGNGTFGAPATFATATHPTSIAVGDLNGDGKQDIVTANYASNNVSVLLGQGRRYVPDGGQLRLRGRARDGRRRRLERRRPPRHRDGQLQPQLTQRPPEQGRRHRSRGHVDYNTGSGPYSLDVADVNHDGVPDIVTTNHVANTVSVLLGNGNGTFAAHVRLRHGQGSFLGGAGRLQQRRLRRSSPSPTRPTARPACCSAASTSGPRRRPWPPPSRARPTASGTSTCAPSTATGWAARPPRSRCASTRRPPRRRPPDCRPPATAPGPTTATVTLSPSDSGSGVADDLLHDRRRRPADLQQTVHRGH